MELVSLLDLYEGLGYMVALILAGQVGRLLAVRESRKVERGIR